MALNVEAIAKKGRTYIYNSKGAARFFPEQLLRVNPWIHLAQHINFTGLPWRYNTLHEYISEATHVHGLTKAIKSVWPLLMYPILGRGHNRTPRQYHIRAQQFHCSYSSPRRYQSLLIPSSQQLPKHPGIPRSANCTIVCLLYPAWSKDYGSPTSAEKGLFSKAI